MSENEQVKTIPEHVAALYDALLDLQRWRVLIDDKVNLLENGLYSERKRNSGILRKIKRMKEDPEVQQFMDAINPETRQNMMTDVNRYLQTLKPGDSIPEQLLNSGRTLYQTGERRNGTSSTSSRS